MTIGGLANGQSVRVVDLAQPVHAGIPYSPSHPGYKHALLRRHGDAVRVDGTSGANDIITLGTHTATHMDALAHISHNGLLHGGVDAREAQVGGLYRDHGIHTVEPIVTPALMLDVPKVHGVDRLPAGYAITPEDLQAAEAAAGRALQPGQAALVRTGWAQLWGDPEAFLSHDDGVPGPNEAACEWLAARDLVVVGSDTTAFEHIPAGEGHARLPGHRVLLVEAGIPIMEMLNLEGLVGNASPFTLVAAPLRLVGTTGSPLRPLALLDA